MTPEFRVLHRPFFPWPAPASSPKPFKALIGVGGNVGNVERRLRKLFFYLCSHREIDLLATSPLYKNPPFGYADQPPFINAILLVATALPPERLLARLLKIEARFGRVRTFKNAPRTLDLDIIFYESKTLYNRQLTIPHPGWRERPSVLAPMVLTPAAR